MALYGWALSDGVGIAQDEPRGNQLLRQCKHSMARVWCLLYGIGCVEQDDNTCFEMLNTECDTSDPHVQFMLGVCHHYGWGCVDNETQRCNATNELGIMWRRCTFWDVCMRIVLVLLRMMRVLLCCIDRLRNKA
eukprot:TRINITY_DN1939_c0_g1_i5.p1 TRINITY_DN1939_c0_g1~~TRINITY_DN1939_c0_g1_i5.p1  ORF type:complete len:148 (-),score=18.78 TRINITY_DN1939_c0_g1_i5:18-419(-)